MKYIVTKEIKSEIKLVRWIYFQDLVLIAIICGLAFFLKGLVHSNIRILYGIYSIIMAIMMVLPSNSNPGRRNYQAIVLYWMRSKQLYIYQKGEECGGRKKDQRRRHPETRKNHQIRSGK